MTCGRDEVDAGVDSGVRDSLFAVDEDLLSQVALVLLIDVLRDGLPAKGKGERMAGWGAVGSARQLFSTVQPITYFGPGGPSLRQPFGHQEMGIFPALFTALGICDSPPISPKVFFLCQVHPLPRGQLSWLPQVADWPPLLTPTALAPPGFEIEQEKSGERRAADIVAEIKDPDPKDEKMAPALLAPFPHRLATARPSSLEAKLSLGLIWTASVG